MRSEFLRHIGAPNEPLRLIVIYYIFNYTFEIKTTLLESLRNQKSTLEARFRHNLTKGRSFCASDFLRLVGAQNQSLRVVIIQYMFKYSCRIKTTLLVSRRSQKTHLKARFR